MTSSGDPDPDGNLKPAEDHQPPETPNRLAATRIV